MIEILNILWMCGDQPRSQEDLNSSAIRGLLHEVKELKKKQIRKHKKGGTKENAKR